MLHYFLNCFLLFIPVFLWNIFLTKRLPVSFSKAVFWKDIPKWVSAPENILRLAVFVLPVMMPLAAHTEAQEIGWCVYAAGLLLYFASWMMQIYRAQSVWSRSAAGFLAPAYTSVFWLAGIGLIGSETFVAIPYHAVVYWTLAVLFTAFHTLHAYVVFARVRATGA